jgi:hypothetical protein
VDRNQLFWKKVNGLASQWPETVGIISVEALLLPPEEWRAGVVCMAPRKLGAQRVLEGSHRLASAEEVAAMRAEQQKREEQCAAVEASQSRKSSLSVHLALAEALKQLGANPEK